MSKRNTVAQREPLTLLTEPQGFPLEAVEALSAMRDEPGWLMDRRRDAWRIFQETPMPSSTDEAWRRTDIRALKLDRFSAFAAPSQPGIEVDDPPAEVVPPLETEAGLVLHHNGGSAGSWLADEWRSAGVTFTDLSSAVRAQPKLVRDHLLIHGVTAADGKFEALHAAFWNAGAVLHVPEGVSVGAPLRIVHWADAAGAAQFGHLLVIAEPGSRVSLILESRSAALAEPSLSSAATEIFVGDGAAVEFINLQEWQGPMWHFATQRAVMGPDARISWAEATLGGQLSRTRLEVLLQGRGSEAQLQAVILPSGRQHFAYHTVQHHQAEHTTSDLLFKGVLQEQARSVFQGLIKVAPGAQRTDAYQADRNLLLSDEARADAIPTLEIEANDVRCTHGATVSQIDEEELFYAMSRGLDRRSAQRLIVEGFLESVIERFPIEEIRDRVRERLHAKLQG